MRHPSSSIVLATEATFLDDNPGEGLQNGLQQEIKWKWNASENDKDANIPGILLLFFYIPTVMLLERSYTYIYTMEKQRNSSIQ